MNLRDLKRKKKGFPYNIKMKTLHFLAVAPLQLIVTWNALNCAFAV